jgi:serine/threonine protein kinase
MVGLDPLIRQDSLIGGKYRLGPVIGSSGVAAVYRATHLWTEREVAVKLLDPTLPHFERLREGFLREARATVRFDHPNVVDVLDMGEDNWDTVYLVMELLEGPTLRDVLIEHGQLSEEYTLAVLLPLVDALDKAHQLGIVHRDFKPENIVLTLDSYGNICPKLLDFGVAEILQDKRSRDLSNNGKVIMGTPQYMSPEQVRDEGHLVGAHTDVWALGVVWYECLTGQAPFVGESTVDVLTAVCESPVDFERVPEAYVSLLRDALGRTPEDRISTLSDFKARIEDVGISRSSMPPARALLSSAPPPSVRSKTNLTLSGLGPEALYPAERISIAADAELATVPVRSHRKALLGGLALAIAVALSAWWTVRDPGQGSPSLQEPAIVEPETPDGLEEPYPEPIEPLEEVAAVSVEEVAAEPGEEVIAVSVEEVVAEPGEEVTAVSVEEFVAEPGEEVTAVSVEEVVKEPVEEATVEPEPKAAKPAASKPQRKASPKRRKKPAASKDSEQGGPPALVTEW